MVADMLKKSCESGKGVCAKTLSHGDVAWKCETCEKDPTCIICQECFEKGDHKGHKIFLKRSVSGCCDCGDSSAWEESGFCSKHKGYAQSSEALLEQLPSQIKKSTNYVFRHISYSLKIACL
jgi:E3 ubiquitin-protein ligase UBR3